MLDATFDDGVGLDRNVYIHDDEDRTRLYAYSSAFETQNN